MLLYHGSNQIVEYPEIRKGKYTKDFSWGFYTTNSYEQAKRWAEKKGKNGQAIINVYEYHADTTLATLIFHEMTDEWLDFVVNCRSGQAHRYDIVEGAMADDTIWNYINDFIYGDISREQFWILAKFKYPTHQMSFHTLSSLYCLEFKEAIRV